MMRCDELNRWLDEGMPAEGAAMARAHAAACSSCAGALGAFESIDRALAIPPPMLADGAVFSARVMAHVGTASPFATPSAPPERKLWWLAILSGPDEERREADQETDS